MNPRYPYYRPRAIAVPYPATFEVISMREKLSILRDTLVVLSLQIAFRTTMFFRRLNY
jgi:hypothetical protein